MEIFVPTSTSASGIWNVKTVRNSILNYSWPRQSIEVRYLIAAGGGGGGSDMGGGGGGGGVLTNVSTGAGGQSTSERLLSPGTYTIIVGQGGAGAPAGTGQPRGSNGGNSSALGLTAIGGGGGASGYDNPNSPAGNGGCGGGGSGARGGTVFDTSSDVSATRGGAHGLGTPGQGENGSPSGRTWYPGGGGGAQAIGGFLGWDYTGTIYKPGQGGSGKQVGILSATSTDWGSDVIPFGRYPYFGGGGGGAGYTAGGGSGGNGGGGAGAIGGSLGETSLAQPKAPLGGGSEFGFGSRGGNGETNSWANQPGGNGADNSGGGGGGGSHYNANNYGGNGGSGVVIIRYNGIQRFTGGTIVQWCDRSQSASNSLERQNRSLLRTAHIFYESGELVG